MSSYIAEVERMIDGVGYKDRRIEELELELYDMNALYGQVKDGLEAKLAKAVEFIEEVRRNGDTRLASMAIAVLAELEGK
jgi:hypothetical protein